MAQLLQMLSGQSVTGANQSSSTSADTTGGGGGGGGGEQLSPEERLARRYRVQLNILEGMGFLERTANLQGRTVYMYMKENKVAIVSLLFTSPLAVLLQYVCVL